MSDPRIIQEVSAVTRLTDDDQWMNLRGTRDGSMISADWLTAMALEGRCFGANTGVDTSPDTFTAAYTAAKPDLLITVPAGTTIIPVFIQINMEDTGTAAIMDWMAVASSVYDAAYTGTDVTIYNMRMDAPRASLCTVGAVISAGGTTPLTGNFIEFWRGTAGFAADAFNGNTTPTSELITRTAWNVKDSLVPPVIVGESSLNVYASCQAGLGFITVIWVEVPSNSIQ